MFYIILSEAVVYSGSVYCDICIVNKHVLNFMIFNVQWLKIYNIVVFNEEF